MAAGAVTTAGDEGDEDEPEKHHSGDDEGPHPSRHARSFCDTKCLCQGTLS